jgi:hypothetical protein
MSRIDSRGELPADGRRHPWRGEVELAFGAPIHFAWDTDHAAATATLEEAVAAL